jgi:hypothetical protein
VALTLTGINRYPIKSCRGQAVDHAVVERWGLAGDRRWMLVDDEGYMVTARVYPQLVLVTPEFHADGLLVRAPDMDPLLVCTPDGATLSCVRVFASEMAAAPASEEAHVWFSKVVGAPAMGRQGLVRDQPHPGLTWRHAARRRRGRGLGAGRGHRATAIEPPVELPGLVLAGADAWRAWGLAEVDS